MKITRPSLCLITLILISGCARMKVSSQIDPLYCLADITTYQWTDPAPAILEQDDTYLDNAMKQALNSQLAARGWKQVLDAADATVQVSCYFKIKSHHEYATTTPEREGGFSGGLVFDRQSGKWSYQQQSPDQIAYPVVVATLHFDMNETGSGRSIWQGRVETVFDHSRHKDARTELFQQIAGKLFAKLPEGTRK